jgi:sec-independent protein translocase protein TatC
LSSEGFQFSEHISELRKRLKVVFLSFIIALILIVFFPANPVQQAQNLGQYLNLQFLDHTLIAVFLHRVVAYVLPSGWRLIAANGLGGPMEVYFVASILLTIVVCMPVIAYETYKFVDPALKDEERKLVYPFVISTTALFAVGIAFGYFVIAKYLVIFLAPFFQATGTSYMVDTTAFYYIIFLIVGATGVSFTAPVFVYTLIRLRVLDPEFFSKNRVIIWFLVWVVTGLFLTPDGGPLLDLAIFVPIVALIEGAVLLARHGLREGTTGRRVSTEPKCAHCGARLARKNLFCPSCGRASA